MLASGTRDEIGNHGDVAPVAVYVEQDEMRGCEESIQQQAKQKDGGKFVYLTAVSSYTTT